MKLRSMVLVAASIIVLSSCGPTNEEKAQKMAANYLKGSLFHFDSYEPLKTEVDSLFVSLSTDEEAIGLTMDMLKLFQSLNDYSDKIKDAERSMDIHAPNFGYTTSYSQGEYRRAKEERDDNQRKLERTVERIENQFAKIKERQAELDEGSFNGWVVYHKFKSLNGARTVDLVGENIFICDVDFNEKSAYSIDEYESLRKVMDIISSSGDVSEMIEKCQSEIY